MKATNAERYGFSSADDIFWPFKCLLLEYFISSSGHSVRQCYCVLLFQMLCSLSNSILWSKRLWRSMVFSERYEYFWTFVVYGCMPTWLILWATRTTYIEIIRGMLSSAKAVKFFVFFFICLPMALLFFSTFGWFFDDWSHIFAEVSNELWFQNTIICREFQEIACCRKVNCLRPTKL